VLDFAGGQEWCILKLGVPGIAEHIEVDTNHFKGNFPDSIVVEAAKSSEADDKDCSWPIVLLTATKLRPHERHFFPVDPNYHGSVISHIKVTIKPDGGISRLRLLGRLSSTK
jgi:allantoicase